MYNSIGKNNKVACKLTDKQQPQLVIAVAYCSSKYFRMSTFTSSVDMQ